MTKKELNGSVFYTIQWSKYYKYERIMAGRILPDMPGILFFHRRSGEDYRPLLCFASWREGVRSGLKNLMDESVTTMPDTARMLNEGELYYRYAIVDTNPFDMQDIFYDLIRSYGPELNNIRSFDHSKRYREISVREERLK